MIWLPQTAGTRIAFAIGVSLLVHILFLLAPPVNLPPDKIPLPPLTAKLEKLPAAGTRAAPRKMEALKTKPKFRPAPVAENTAPPPNDSPAESIQPELRQTDPEPHSPATAEVAEKIQPAHPLPKHAQLTFIAYKGTNFEIGEARHRLEVNDGNHYMLKADMNTTGLASIFKAFASSQQSNGIITRQGLRPNEFNETKNTFRGKETLGAKFAWEEKSLFFLNGSRASLPEQAQDIVSFIYQLSQLPLDGGVIPIHISNGKKLERYELAIGEEEEIETRIGKLRALPLRKIHAQGEEGLDIWLGLEYRLLPVKIRQIDRNGEIAGEMVVSDIRVADE